MQDNQRQTHWAYIAGIMDADGCFMIVRQSRKKENEDVNRRFVESWAPSYMPAAKVSMVEIEAIHFLTEELGLGKYNLNGARKGRKNSKPIYHWYLRGRKNIIPFLNQVIPFLRVKKNVQNFF